VGVLFLKIMVKKIKSRLQEEATPVPGCSIASGGSIFRPRERLRTWGKPFPPIPGICLLVLLLFLLSLAAPVYGFVRLPSKERMTVRVVGTKNFGEELVFDKQVEVRVGATAGEALEQAVEIDMSGSFIETIAGIKGGQTEYWFYYINGVMANVFAHGYKLHPGDVQYWDFHDWTFYMHGPSAVLGAFPEPCRQGYGGKVAPTMVAYAEGFQDDAQKLKGKLTALGVREVTVKDAASLTAEEKGKSNLFLIAPAGHHLLGELNKQYREQGTVYFEGEKIIVRNHKGKPAATYGPGHGLLQVTQNPWNSKGSWVCEGTVWLVSGVDETGVKRSANILTSQPEKLKYTFAAVVGNGEMVKAPVGPAGVKTVAVQTEENISREKQAATEKRTTPEKQVQPSGEKTVERKTGEEIKITDKERPQSTEEKQQDGKQPGEPQAGPPEEKQGGSTGEPQAGSGEEKPSPDEQLQTFNNEQPKPLNRPADFWWIIPLAAAAGAGAWWLKRKRS